MRARSRLQSRISTVVAVGALLVAAGVTLLLINTIALRNSARATSATQIYLLRVGNVEGLTVDAETGLRGYVITGRTLFLQPLHRAQSLMPQALAALNESASQERAHHAQAAALNSAVHAYMSYYVRLALALAGRDLHTAQSLSVTLIGKQLVDRIRTRVADLERALVASQTRRQTAARNTANRSIIDAIVVLGLLTLLTLIIGTYLGRLVFQRERARDASEETTRILQQSILPTGVPKIPGCEVATRFIPGGGVVSGDFYDVVDDGHGGWDVIIGDVCGKGAAAAAATAMARWTLRSSLRHGATPADALRFLNDVALGEETDGRFITAACLRMTFGPEGAELTVACAGHPPPILVPRSGTPEPVAADGDLLGIMPTIRLRTAEVRLRPGDSLVAYTDGVTDQGPEVRRAPDEVLGERSLDADADELAEILRDLAQQPPGSHPDDVAIVALRYLGEAATPAAGERQEAALSPSR